MEQQERLVDALESSQDSFDRAFRPLSLDDFTGQSHIRENLKIFTRAARERGEPMDHVLLFGPPGLGKTTLAQIVSKELGVGFKSTSGPVLSRAGDLAAILTNIQPKDVLFIDEIHRLNPVVEEILYPAMEDFKLDLIIGEGPSARSICIDLPPFTLVGATTRSGLITTPLRERFGIPLHMQFYKPDELQMIVSRSARLMQFNLLPEGALEIAKRSRGTPRIAGRLLRRVRDITTMEGCSVIGAKETDRALNRLQVDGFGLDAMDRTYMMRMAENYNGGPVGIETMAAVLSEQRDVVEEVIEPYLIQQGFIQRTPRGRVLTLRAYEHLGLNLPDVLPETRVAEAL